MAEEMEKSEEPKGDTKAGLTCQVCGLDIGDAYAGTERRAIRNAFCLQCYCGVIMPGKFLPPGGALVVRSQENK